MNFPPCLPVKPRFYGPNSTLKANHVPSHGYLQFKLVKVVTLDHSYTLVVYIRGG